MHSSLSKTQSHYIRPTPEPQSATSNDGAASQELAFYCHLEEMETEKHNITCPKYQTILVTEQCTVYLCNTLCLPALIFCLLQWIGDTLQRNTADLFNRLCPTVSRIMDSFRSHHDISSVNEHYYTALLNTQF